MATSSFNIFRLSGDFLHVLSIFFLWIKMQKSRSCSGLSLKSQILFFTVYVTRYLDLFSFIFNGRFLHISSIYNFLMKCLFIGSQGSVLYYMWFRYRSSYNAKLDTVKLEYIIAPCVLLSFFFTETGSHNHTIMFYIREVSQLNFP